MMHDGNMQWCIFWANEAWNYLIFFPWSFLSWSICSWPDQIRSTQLGENLSELAFSLLCTSNYLVKTHMLKIRMRYATSEKVLPNCDYNSLTPTYFVTIWVLEICFSILLLSIMHNIEWYIGRLKMKYTFLTNIIQ